MTDINLLTIVLGCSMLMLIARLPENQAFQNWGFIHLTADLLIGLLLTMGVIVPMLYILGVQVWPQ